MRIRLSPMLPIGILLFALAMSGCGQKGPLYHPDATPPAKPAAAPAPAPAPATRAPR